MILTKPQETSHISI